MEGRAACSLFSSQGAIEGPVVAEVLAGKVLLVSGVGPGLGREVARQALEGGASVVLGDLDGEALQAIAAALGFDARTVALEVDIRSLSACEQLVEAAGATFGRLDGVVHVAAYDAALGGLLDGDLDEWDTTADVNVKGTLQLTKAAVPLLRDSGGGAVVMVGSIAAAEPVDEVIQLVYGMSKAALAAGAYYLARELGPLGIRVNTVAPGWKWNERLKDGFDHMAVGTQIACVSAKESRCMVQACKGRRRDKAS